MCPYWINNSILELELMPSTKAVHTFNTHMDVPEMLQIIAPVTSLGFSN